MSLHDSLLLNLSTEFDLQDACDSRRRFFFAPPGGERHWAQRNVAYVPSTPGGVIDFSFWAANPDQRECEFTLDDPKPGNRHTANASLKRSVVS